MKHIGTLLWVGVVLLGLSACGTANSGTEAAATDPVTETAVSQTEVATEAADPETEATESTEPATETTTEPATEEAGSALHTKASDFFYKDEVWTKYFTGDDPSGTFTAEPQYTDGNRMQVAVCGDSVRCELEVWEVQDGRIVQTAAAQEAWFRQNLLTREEGQFENLLDEPIVQLQDPIEVGATWTSGTLTMKITDVIPATHDHGARVVVDQSVEGSDGGTVFTYEEGLWVVKRESSTAESQTVSSLERYETTLPQTQVSLYYPSMTETEGDHFVKVDVPANFPVNSSAREILAQLYKEHVPANGMPVLKAEDAINSLYLNQDGNVYVDVSQSFSNMNAGSSGEPLILKAMAFTAAGLMNGTEGVILTLDNQLYEGGHVSFEQGETLPAVPGDADTVTEIE